MRTSMLAATLLLAATAAAQAGSLSPSDPSPNVPPVVINPPPRAVVRPVRPRILLKHPPSSFIMRNCKLVRTYGEGTNRTKVMSVKVICPDGH